MSIAIPQPPIPTFRSGTPRIEEVGDGLFAYIQPDGTWSINNPGFLVGPDGVVSVDTCETVQRTQAYIDAVRSFTGHEIRTVINTHHHPDHTSGNGMLPHATIVAHELTRVEMIAQGLIKLPGIFESFDNGDPPFLPPFLTYTDGVTLWLGDRRCEVQHVGSVAHTTNDSIVWVPDQEVLYAGDLFFKGGTPFLLSGSVTGLIDVLERVIRPLGATTIVPGHGPVCGSEVIDETVDYLRFVSTVAGQALSAGMSPLDAARDLDLGRFAEWTDSERIVGNLHRAMAELDGLPAGGRLDVRQVFQEMVTYNGGPLSNHA
ncbi:MBL fold metallo-hydrolase [Mycolicibacterium sp. CBMA 226]|uniref:MBL fold metallo-hydrolase n=1 Tax=Mycolicibacterium sp. CBMA 226 TaxID=2606611 RepID=UPI0012DCF603|nr:MBL fold metallo-hydrolase [Mycolicibacterium sp. CBMA 226]MUL79002.1 MBL fold metallo-hydrolase [Mycolicibacterium sp. CBMA 226]QGW61318.1 Hydroxyacylglutathione hydrolase [Mycolicibacterium sp.]